METTPPEILARLHGSESARFPKAAIQEIIARRDEMIPHLIAVLESVHADPAEYLEGPRVMLTTYAANLLTQFRETRAYRPLLALLNLEGDLPEEFFGDSIYLCHGTCRVLSFRGSDLPETYLQTSGLLNRTPAKRPKSRSTV